MYLGRMCQILALQKFLKVCNFEYQYVEEVLLQFNEQRNIVHAIRRRKANWIGHILRRNCFLKQVIEGKIKGEIEVTRKKEEDVKSYWMTVRTEEDTLI